MRGVEAVGAQTVSPGCEADCRGAEFREDSVSVSADLDFPFRARGFRDAVGEAGAAFVVVVDVDATGAADAVAGGGCCAGPERALRTLEIRAGTVDVDVVVVVAVVVDAASCSRSRRSMSTAAVTISSCGTCCCCCERRLP